MALGGHGTANMTGNVAPAEMAALSRPWRGAGDAETFRETYLRLLPLLHFTYSAINPVPVKSLMKALGLPAGDLRRPLRALEGGALASGLEVVRSLGLDGKYAYKIPSGIAAAAESRVQESGAATPSAPQGCVLPGTHARPA
jgi:4-hydroxy-tetrahydrodipicolinate synthase